MGSPTGGDLDVTYNDAMRWLQDMKSQTQPTEGQHGAASAADQNNAPGAPRDQVMETSDESPESISLGANSSSTADDAARIEGRGALEEKQEVAGEIRQGQGLEEAMGGEQQHIAKYVPSRALPAPSWPSLPLAHACAPPCPL